MGQPCRDGCGQKTSRQPCVDCARKLYKEMMTFYQTQKRRLVSSESSENQPPCLPMLRLHRQVACTSLCTECGEETNNDCRRCSECCTCLPPGQLQNRRRCDSVVSKSVS